MLLKLVISAPWEEYGDDGDSEGRSEFVGHFRL